MAKIILGQPPKSFARSPKFTQVDGTPGEIGVTYIYRTRAEFGQFADALIEEQRAAVAAEMDRVEKLVKAGLPVPEMTQSELIAQEAKANVGYVMGCITGWDLTAEFNRAAVEQLADEVPAAIRAICDEYRAAIVEGRRGN
jgi:hypothetical protein